MPLAYTMALSHEWEHVEYLKLSARFVYVKGTIRYVIIRANNVHLVKDTVWLRLYWKTAKSTYTLVWLR